jgi:putative transposase
MTLHAVGPGVHRRQRQSRSWSFGWRPRIPPGGTGVCRVSWSGSAIASPPPRGGRFCTTPVSTRTAPVESELATVSHRPGQALLAVDFLHVNTVLFRRIYALIVVEHGSRRVHLAGVRAHPTGAWITHAARNMLMDLGDRVTTMTFLLRDRDSRFTGSFDAVFTAEGIRILTSSPGAPRANAICERMIGTLRRELLDRILVVNERHLRRILTIYLHHFNSARPHRRLGQLTPAQAETHHHQWST